MMKKCITFILLLIVSNTRLQAQLQGQARIDSLLKALHKLDEDTIKATLLADISLQYQPINPNEGLKYGGQALDLATKLRWKRGIAASYSSIAANYNAKSDNVKVLEYLFKALKIQEEINSLHGIASSVNNIGIIYENQDNFPKALEYFLKGLKMQEARGNKQGVAIACGNVATVYFHMKDYQKALDYNMRALKITEEIGDKPGLPTYMQIIADIYNAKRNYHVALEYNYKALKISEELGDQYNIAVCLGFIGKFYVDMAHDDSVHYTPDSLVPATRVLMLKKGEACLDSAIRLCREIGYRDGILDFSNHLSEAQEAGGRYKEALASYKQFMVMKDSIFNMENNEKITNLETQRELELKDKQIEIERLAVEKKRNERSFFIAGIIGMFIVIAIVFRSYRAQKESNKLLSVEKQKSEDLLLNILPEDVASELKEKGAANAKQFEDVTVLFTDFVNFTEASQKMEPQQLVGELHTCFKAFDEITGRYGIEKIKTIGDAYLAVAGLPKPDPKHAENIVRAATEINTFMTDRLAKMGAGQTFHIRIGIHSGSVVAGIVGVKKFAYDIWGDTVNTAARMEQHGEAGKINISQTTYELVQDKFTCEYRGEVEAKGMGVMKMYFVR